MNFTWTDNNYYFLACSDNVHKLCYANFPVITRKGLALNLGHDQAGKTKNLRAALQKDLTVHYRLIKGSWYLYIYNWGEPGMRI